MHIQKFKILLFSMCIFFTHLVLFAQNSEKSMFKNDLQRTGCFGFKGVPVLHGIKWLFSKGGNIRDNPIACNNIVYFTQYEARYNYALNAETGETVWKYDQGLAESVVIADGIIVYTSTSGNIWAVNANSGIEKWKQKVPRVYSAPIVKERIIYVGADYDDPTGTGLFLTIDLQTGEYIWYTELQAPRTSPALDNATIFVGGGVSLYALDLDGNIKWEFDTGYYVNSTPAIADCTVFFGSDDDHIYAVTTDTGEMKWKVNVGHNVSSSPAVYNGTVFVGSWNGNFYALDCDNGDIKWTYKTGGAILSSPAIANGIVYFGSDDGNVYALDTQTGEKIWIYHLGGQVESSPFIWKDMLFIGSSNGKLVALH